MGELAWRPLHLVAAAVAAALGMAGPRDAGWPYGVLAMLVALAILVDLDR